MEQAVHTLYYGQCPSARKQSEILLEKFRQSPEAWTECDQVLSAPRHASSMEVRFFAAQTLTTKLLKDKTLPGEHILPLVENLLRHARAYVTERACMRQLCLAIGYAAQRAADWPPDSIVKQLCECVAAQIVSVKQEGLVATVLVTCLIMTIIFSSALLPHGEASLADKLSQALVILEVLAPLAAECLDAKFVAGAHPQRREAVRAAYIQAAPYVLMIVADAHAQATDLSIAAELNILLPGLCQELRKTCMTCVDSWVSLAGAEHALIIYTGQDHLDRVLGDLQDDYISPAAASALSAVIKRSNRSPDVMQPVLAKLLTTLPDYQAALSAHNAVLCKILALSYIQAGKSYIPYICDSAVFAACPDLGRLLELNLSLLGNGPFEMAGMTFTLWSHMRDEIASGKYGQASHLDPLFARAVEHVVLRARFSDSYSEWPEDTREEFMLFRREIRDMVRHLVVGRFPNSEMLLLKTLRFGVERELEKADMWTVEALIHGISTVAKQIEANEHEHLAAVFRLMPTMPKHPAVMRTCLLLIGVYAHWLREHPDYLEAAMALIVEGCELPEEADAFPMRDKEDHVAAVAFMKVCGASADHIRDKGFVPNLLEKVKLLQLRVYAGQGPMTCKSIGLLLSGSGSLLSACPPSISGPAFCRHMEICFNALGHILSNEAHHGACDIVSVCDNACDFLNACSFGDIDEGGAHPVAMFVQSHWECIATLAERALNDADELQSICRLLSCSMDTLGTSNALDNVVPHVVDMLLSACSQSQQPCLYLALRLPEVCSERPTLYATLDKCAAAVFSQLTAVLSNGEDGSERSETVAAMYAFAITWGDRWPRSDRTDENLSALLSSVSSGLLQQHKPGAPACTSLLEILWAWCAGKRSSRASVGDDVMRRLQGGWGVAVTRAVLDAINGAMPSWMLDQLASALHELMVTAGPDVFSIWVRDAIADPAFPRESVTPESKAEFVAKACLVIQAMHMNISTWSVDKRRARAERKEEFQSMRKGLLRG